MRQRHLLFVLGIAMMFLFSFAFASDSDDQCDYVPAPEFAWDGELNPNEFDAWEVVNAFVSGPYLNYIIINPDEDASISKVAFLMAMDTIIGYRYFKDGQPYSYLLDENSKYVEYKFTEDEKKGCMQCHQDKLKLNKSI